MERAMGPVCKICGGETKTIFKDHPGFSAPTTFDVAECCWCETRFAATSPPSDQVYDLIYRNAGNVPGYDRYKRYADGLKSSRDGLSFMAEQEDVYWSIKQRIEDIEAQRQGKLRILEIGSGFGYLTYALRQRGHDCVGIDISESAVEGARRNFGPHYEVCDVTTMAVDASDAFDVIVATELIEHVEDPVGLLKSVQKLLKPGGWILLTTPNKDLYSDSLAWHTDAAPVHLYWFGKTSMRTMAWQLGMMVQFVDFSRFYGRSQPEIKGRTKPQTFDEHGNVIYKDSVVNTVARKIMSWQPWTFKVIGRIFVRKMATERAKDVWQRESLSLCAAMRKPA